MRAKKRPYIVGLTGGMAAGKSMVNAMWQDVSDPLPASALFDCDAQVHQLYTDPGIIQLLKDRFGDVGPDARQFCIKLVQQDELVIDDLEKIFIPAVKVCIEDRIRILPYNLMVIDAPLLFETGMQKMCDMVVVVHSPEALRRERIMMRPGMTKEKMEMMLARQISDDVRLALADMIIHTDCTLAQTKQQAVDVLQTMRRLAREHENA